MSDLLENVFKMLGALGIGGFGIAWLTRRKTAAEVGKLEADAELSTTQAKHIRFNELESLVTRLDKRLEVAEAEIGKTRVQLKQCETRERRMVKRMSDIESMQVTLSKAIKNFWPVDHSIPPDMMTLVDQIDKKFSSKRRAR